jgi:hypothetical protein
MAPLNNAIAPPITAARRALFIPHSFIDMRSPSGFVKIAPLI